MTSRTLTSKFNSYTIKFKKSRSYTDTKHFSNLTSTNATTYSQPTEQRPNLILRIIDYPTLKNYENYL